MMWHNKRVVTLNSMFQLLDIYIYIYIYRYIFITLNDSMPIYELSITPPPNTTHLYIYIYIYIPELNKGLCSQWQSWPIVFFLIFFLSNRKNKQGKKINHVIEHVENFYMGLRFNYKGVFGYHLFYWNWKIIAESTIDKCKS